MRVLLIVDDTRTAHGREVASRQWVATVPPLKRRCGEVILITPWERGSLHDALEAQGCTTVALGYRSRLRFLLGGSPRLARIVRSKQIDVIHGHEVIPAIVGGLAGILAGRGLRVFFRCHSTGRRRLTLASRMASRLTQHTMGPSQAVARCAESLDRADTGRVSVVPHGVPDLRRDTREELRELRFRLGIPDGAPVVVTVARLRAEKRIDVLLAAMALVADAVPTKPHVVIVGSGPEEDRLRDVAARFSSFAPHFVGHQSDTLVWYAVADVVAVPSERESFGKVALEAMASARPVVATRAGGLVEIVRDEATGLTVESGDPHALASALTRLLLSPRVAEEMGAAGRRHYEQAFTLEAMIERWASCYEELIAQATAGVPK